MPVALFFLWVAPSRIQCSSKQTQNCSNFDSVQREEELINQTANHLSLLSMYFSVSCIFQNRIWLHLASCWLFFCVSVFLRVDWRLAAGTIRCPSSR